jgi:hypothetical protein
LLPAAKSTHVQHLIFSSLPNITKASNGRFRKVFHFDHEAEIKDLAMRELPAVTALYPGWWERLS